jgi:hypothetical protein
VADAGGIGAGAVGLLQKVDRSIAVGDGDGRHVLDHHGASGNRAGEQRQVEQSRARRIGVNGDFFYFGPSLKKSRNESVRNLFPNYGTFESR